MGEVCDTHGCHNYPARNRYCTTCRRKAKLREAEARGRWLVLRPSSRDLLAPIARDLRVLCHPDAHRGSPKRLALAAAVSQQLSEMFE